MMVANEQVYLIVRIPVLRNALLLLPGIALMEKRSLARDRRRAGLRREQDAPGATWSKTGVQ
jgi:hypothetical protein